jgi:hypothetical protein
LEKNIDKFDKEVRSGRNLDLLVLKRRSYFRSSSNPSKGASISCIRVKYP